MRYEKIIKLGLEKGYQVISLRDYVRKNFDPSQKLLILRHDIDEKSIANYKMFAIEKKYGVKASYYFRICTIDPQLIKAIENYGSEASLHYETIAEFAGARNIQKKETLFKSDFQEKCMEVLKTDLEKFRIIYNAPCETIASHGHLVNRKLGVTNHFLTEDLKAYEFLNIKLEAYNEDFLQNVITCYISDFGLLDINDGYRYGKSPIEAITEEEKCILFLSHPHHWYFSKFERIKKITDCLLDKNKKFYRAIKSTPPGKEKSAV